MQDAIKRIDNDECDENQIASMLATVELNSKGYHHPDEYCTYDKAMRILHINNNPNMLRDLTKLHGVESKTINNRKVGFLRSDLERIKAYYAENDTFDYGKWLRFKTE